MQITGQSNLVSNESQKSYYKALRFVVNELITAMRPVYGPSALDQIIMKADNDFVFTKDGKEILQALTFDNALLNVIRNIILDAAKIQGDKKGDSSTTLILSTCVSVLELLDLQDSGVLSGYKNSKGTKAFAAVTELLEQTIKTIECKKLDTNNLQELTDFMQSVVRDKEIADICANAYYQVDSIPFISFEKDSLSSKMDVQHLREPKIGSKVLFAPALSMFEKFEYKESRIIILDGALDFTDDDLLDMFMVCSNRPTIVITKNIMPSAKDALGRYDRRLQRDKLTDNAEVAMQMSGKPRAIQPLIILTVDDGLKINEDFFRGLFTLVHAEDNFKASKGLGFTVIMQEILSHSQWYQQVCGALSNEESIVNLVRHQRDISTDAKKMIIAFAANSLSLLFEDNSLHFKFHILSPAAQQIKQELEEKLHANDYVGSVKAKEVYRALFGSYIKIMIGSDLLLDRSNKYELVKDGILTGKNALEFGIHRGSILDALLYKIESGPHSTFMTPDGKVLTISETLRHIVSNIISIRGGNTSATDIIDSHDSVTTAILNGFKTAVKLVECSSVLVNNAYNINNSTEIVRDNTKK